jgi:hypothetical protein
MRVICLEEYFLVAAVGVEPALLAGVESLFLHSL